MRRPSSEENLARRFTHVLCEELGDIERSRELRRGGQRSWVTSTSEEEADADCSTADKDETIERAHRAQLVGLAFSGGGIRSATFNLGVLQELARLKLLKRFDYLSTVSGGGYVGTWLTAWIKRAANGLDDVTEGLSTERQGGSGEPREIRFLRRFSNYLTPRKGVTGADTWTAIAVYVRNLVLNLLILVTALLALLLIPRILYLLFKWMATVQMGADSIN
ncbi:MAG: patatin-like phospholipase family protein, partial [Gemmatimonadota bacterium]